MFETVLNAVLVCHHRRTTFPVTPIRERRVAARRTYIVCLDCGAELPYDWNLMKVVPSGVGLGRNLCSPAVDRAAASECPAASESRAPGKEADRAPGAPAPHMEEVAQRAADPRASVACLREPEQATPVAQPIEPPPRQAAAPSRRCAAETAAGAAEEPAGEPSAPWNPKKQSLRLPIPAEPAVAMRRSSADTAGSGQYMVRARLRMQQMQVAMRVLNALMTGRSAQDEDVARLRAWSDPSLQACSTRELAARVVTCAVSP